MATVWTQRDQRIARDVCSLSPQQSNQNDLLFTDRLFMLTTLTRLTLKNEKQSLSYFGGSVDSSSLASCSRSDERKSKRQLAV
jgi:hypothetical protein